MICDDCSNCSRHSCRRPGVGSSSASRTRTGAHAALARARSPAVPARACSAPRPRGVALHRLDALRKGVVGIEPEAERADESDGQRDPDGKAFESRAPHRVRLYGVDRPGITRRVCPLYGPDCIYSAAPAIQSAPAGRWPLTPSGVPSGAANEPVVLGAPQSPPPFFVLLTTPALRSTLNGFSFRDPFDWGQRAAGTAFRPSRSIQARKWPVLTVSSSDGPARRLHSYLRGSTIRPVRVHILRSVLTGCARCTSFALTLLSWLEDE